MVFLFSLQDLYRILLTAESEGLLDDVNMSRVEKVLLDPELKKKSRNPSGDTDVKNLETTTVQKKLIDDLDLD